MQQAGRECLPSAGARRWISESDTDLSAAGSLLGKP